MKENDFNNFMEKFFNLQGQLSKLEKSDDREKFIETNSDVFKQSTRILVNIIKKGQYIISYQPQVPLKNNRLRAEALFRLSYNGRKVYPDVIFSLIGKFGQEFGLSERDLTLKLLNSVCQQITKFQDDVEENFYISYNVSPKFIDKNFCEDVLRICKMNNVAPQNIGIELLETSSFNDIDISDIKFLKQQGFKILLDDFGAGFANEEILKKLPFDVVKFSGKIISGISANEANLKRVNKAIKFCHNKNIITVAEHVDNEEDYKAVVSLGIDQIQGWYFSKDLPLEQFIQKYGHSSQKLK